MVINHLLTGMIPQVGVWPRSRHIDLHEGFIFMVKKVGKYTLRPMDCMGKMGSYDRYRGPITLHLFQA